MNGYFKGILDCYHHAHPKKPQLSTHKHTEISYGSKVQSATEDNSRPPLDTFGIKRVQSKVVALLYYARAIYNKLLVDLCAIGSQHYSAAECTSAAIDHLLDYVTKYPNDSINYRTSSVVIAGHSDASFLNESKACSREGGQICLSKDVPIPANNGPILTLSQIIKFDISSTA